MPFTFAGSNLYAYSHLGFLFPNHDAVWKAMDGDLGVHIRAQIAKTPIMAVSKRWDNGFRHITSSGKEISAKLLAIQCRLTMGRGWGAQY
jgi:TRAP-type C4-dicarboxylate transport system substrate-binding protein